MVWLRREDLEDRELHSLSPWATMSRNAGGRRLAETEDPLRTVFQRDRDRVIHCTAFRRLQGKTQVVAAFEGDHYRSRLTHSLEVAQISRSAATALRLNADLAEAIALMHDLGHPPFGHMGESALDELMQGHGGFRHNAQGVRIVDCLEDRYDHGHGLNLTLESRRSLLKGRIPEGFPITADLLPRATPPIEAQIVDLCDKIAYLAHDLDDGLRAGLFSTAEAAELKIWQRGQAAAASDLRHRIVSEITAVLIYDLVDTNDRALTDRHPAGDRPHIAHGPTLTVESQELLEFLRARFYQAERVLAVMRKGTDRIRARFADLLANPNLMPETYRDRIDTDGLHRVTCDYVAGMTDRYLLSE